MSARIFISYRTADGADKATALARDLGRVFGDAAIFLDKDDLPGGSSWRDKIALALDARPVLLLLVTPALLAAERLTRPDDPVARELDAALAANAYIIPLLCDGFTAPPDCATLPAPYNRIGDFTWRPLRAYDWRHDVQRLLGDLAEAGIEPADTPSQAASAAAMPHSRRLRWMLGGVFLVAALAGLWFVTKDVPEGSLSGRWQAVLWEGERVVVELTEAEGRLTLSSEPIAIDTRPDWIEYRQFWHERTGAPLDAVRYRGEGKRLDSPGVAPAIDVGYEVLPAPHGNAVIDGGNLSATLSPDGRTLTGRIWRNSTQSEQVAQLTRLR